MMYALAGGLVKRKRECLIMHKLVYVYELTIAVGGDTDIPASIASANRELQWHKILRHGS